MGDVVSPPAATSAIRSVYASVMRPSIALTRMLRANTGTRLRVHTRARGGPRQSARSPAALPIMMRCSRAKCPIPGERAAALLLDSRGSPLGAVRSPLPYPPDPEPLSREFRIYAGAILRTPPADSKGGSGRGCPLTPLLGRPILGLAKPPKSAPFGGEFLRFFEACGAAPRGGGGAPPTTLILLRNQRAHRPRAVHLVPAGRRAASASLSLQNLRKNAKFFVFFSSC